MRECVLILFVEKKSRINSKNITQRPTTQNERGDGVDNVVAILVHE